LEKAFEILVSKEIITEKESEDLQSIISLRNQIGHKIHELVSDISAPKTLRERDQIYDYFALNRFERHREKISRGMMKHFVLEVSFRDLVFEQAEATYKEELRRLHKRIERQYAERRSAESVLKFITSSIFNNRAATPFFFSIWEKQLEADPQPGRENCR
jgi:hypothetical protein